MNMKKIVAGIVGVSGAIGVIAVTMLSKKSSKSDVVKIIPETTTIKEESFGGVPLSKLNELAKEIYHGINCTIDKCGYLWFNYKSKRGHETHRAQMSLDTDGKLVKLFSGYYPGQRWNSADLFIKKANEIFKFDKE